MTDRSARAGRAGLSAPRPASALAAAMAAAAALASASGPGAPGPGGAPGAARAQGAAPEVVAVVNDEPFTRHDLEQRISLALFASGASDTPESRAAFAAPVLDALVGEYLRARDALRNGFTPDEEHLQRVLEDVAARGGLSLEDFLIELDRRGVSRAILEENIISQILWSANVARVYRPRIRVADSEVDTALAIAIESSGEPHVELAEIVVPLLGGGDEAERDESARESAAAVAASLRAGEMDFAEAARAFSGAATAGAGGALGWIPESRLSPARRGALAGLEPGGVAEPVRERGAWVVMLLLGRRDGPGEEVRPSLLRLTLPPGSGEEEVEEARASLGGCRGLRRLEAEGAEGAADIGPFRPGELSERLEALLEGLPTGEPSAALPPGSSEGARGPSIYVACPPGKGSPEWNRAYERLARERLDALLRNTERRLRREAQIEIRL